jgi:hypothetical protein
MRDRPVISSDPACADLTPHSLVVAIENRSDLRRRHTNCGPARGHTAVTNGPKPPRMCPPAAAI